MILILVRLSMYCNKMHSHVVSFYVHRRYEFDNLIYNRQKVPNKIPSYENTNLSKYFIESKVIFDGVAYY